MNYDNLPMLSIRHPLSLLGFLNSELDQADRLKVDIKDIGDSLILHANVPGIKKEDISISIDNNVLSLIVESSNTYEEKDGEKVIRSERSFQKQQRSFNLNEEIDVENIKASIKDGVLTLTLPKVEVKKPEIKQITVE